MKYHAVMAERGKSACRKYRDLYYGDRSLVEVIWAEFVQLVCANMPGALGLWLRSKLYPFLFASVGEGVVFGRNMTLRHAHKIHLGNDVVLDDNTVLDAKGTTNRGITVGDHVYVGRNTIIYCKNGDIRIEREVNLSANCILFSAHALTIGEGAMVGAYAYFLSGGEYDLQSALPFCRQDGVAAKAPTVIGRNNWIGAGVIVLDGAGTGENCVVGAGAVVTRPLPDNTVAVGVPARAIRMRTETASKV